MKRSPVMNQFKGHRRMSKAQLKKMVRCLVKFGPDRFQELPLHRNIKENVSALPLRSNGTTDFTDAPDLSSFADQFRSADRLADTGLKGHLRNGGDARKGLSPEPKGVNGEEVFRFPDLARRIP